AIDLALEQAGTNLFSLLDVIPRPVRYVVSFGRVADPAAEARRHPGVELKIDADPWWDDDVYRAPAKLGRVAGLDFKGHGDGRAQLRTLAALLCPDATNDIAPLLVDGARPPRLAVDGDEIGFGGEA